MLLLCFKLISPHLNKHFRNPQPSPVPVTPQSRLTLDWSRQVCSCVHLCHNYPLMVTCRPLFFPSYKYFCHLFFSVVFKLYLIIFYPLNKMKPSVELKRQTPENVSKQTHAGPLTKKFDFFSAMSDPAKNRR